MFIEKRPTYPLQSRRDDMFMLLSNVTHFVPTGLKRGCSILIYKHIVPTGLNMGQYQSQCLLRVILTDAVVFLN